MDKLGRWIDENGLKVIASLAIIDVITLAITVVIALNQHHAIQRANDAANDARHAAHQANHAVDVVKNRVCRNSIALIQTDKRQIEGYNRQLAQLKTPDYIVTVLGVSPEAAQTIIDQTTAQFNQGKASAYRAIHDLSQNCSAEQLQQVH